MEKPERVILTNMCMIRQGHRVLVEAKKTQGRTGIVFPGGHVEPGEPIVDSVIREMREETGLTIERPRLLGVKDWLNEDGSRYVVFLFRAESFTGTLRSSEEGEVFWVEQDELLGLDWMWHMDKLMRIFAEEAYAELFLDSSDDWTPVLK